VRGAVIVAADADDSAASAGADTGELSPSAPCGRGEAGWEAGGRAWASFSKCGDERATLRDSAARLQRHARTRALLDAAAGERPGDRERLADECVQCCTSSATVAAGESGAGAAAAADGVPPPERGAIGDAGALPRFTLGVDGEEPLDGSPPESFEKEDMEQEL
jgi:hypothetical protein